ncbi:MAG: hypothetical protein M3O01_00550 [Pseudomonadota bacterium]|nr:hypothetical protein [Pseudomonadota bacterium]
MQRRYRLLVATATAAVTLAATSGLQAQTRNFKQTHYFKLFGIETDGADRAGYEADNRAYPSGYVAPSVSAKAASDADDLEGRGHGHRGSWTLVGPTTGTVPGPVTYTGHASTVSGRVTGLAISPRCKEDDCTLFVGAAGGGVWRTDNALSRTPEWESASRGLPSNAIGSIVFDPSDDKARTLYVGTGEANGSSDSEAGLGLFKSTDLGRHWTLVPGSVAVARGRAIAAVAVDPGDARHLFIGTAVARHGASSVNGGRFTPPDAPPLGLYESRNGGATFTLAFSVPADTVVPSSPNGSDFFRGGISKIQMSRTGLATSNPTRVYFSIFGYGLYRSAAGGGYEKVFASAGGGTAANSLASRTEFALAPMGQKLRIYLGDAGAAQANFYRTDDANVPAIQLANGAANPGWTKLSDATPGTPGFSSFNFCGGQCTYDMVVASPPGRPDTVWLGGQMQYSEIFTASPPSNGRAVQRSTNAGVQFTDMTNDTQMPAPLGLHPDQHALVFVPGNPDVGIMGSDGGVVRTSGAYADVSGGCDARGIAGADLADCKLWLKAVPVEIIPMNAGLSTLQFQSVSVDPQHPLSDLIGGTQDNGTWSYSGQRNSWFESVGGDGGQSGIDAVTPSVRMHSYTGAALDVNFQGSAVLGWDYVSDPLVNSNESASFYVPLLADPVRDGTWFVGLQRVWRTLDSGGPRADLDAHCNEYTGDFAATCGDWVPLGTQALTGTAYGATKGGSYVVAVARAPSAGSALWVATRRGRLFVSVNADGPAATTTFTRIDTDAQPARFISGIAVDPWNPLHAFVSYSGYDAYTPATPGHVFEVVYEPTTGLATWTDRSNGLGDQPITGVALDARSGRLYASTDFGVAVLPRNGPSWFASAAGRLPPVAVYGLTIDASSRTLYAATHGRGVWRLDLSDAD